MRSRIVKIVIELEINNSLETSTVIMEKAYQAYDLLARSLGKDNDDPDLRIEFYPESYE